MMRLFAKIYEFTLLIIYKYRINVGILTKIQIEWLAIILAAGCHVNHNAIGRFEYIRVQQQGMEDVLHGVTGG